MKKVMFIASTGGHLDELQQLSPLFEKYDAYIVTEKDKTTISLKNKYKDHIFYLVYGSRTHPFSYFFKLFFNCFKSLFIFLLVRPKVIVSTGAHSTGPMCCIGKLLGSKIIFIETFANSKTKSVTGKLVYLFADVFIVQWEEMLKLYPKAKYFGGVY